MVPDGDGSRAYLELDDSALLAQCNVDTYRARGPGGQKRNKTDSAVRLRHRPTRVMAIAVESRSQHQNRAKALKRLRLAIALQIRGSLDPRSYRLSDTLRACMNEHRKLGVGRRDARRPMVIGEVFDVLWSLKGRVSTAAECLGITTANLSAFLCADPKLKAEANRMRQVFGLRPLR